MTWLAVSLGLRAGLVNIGGEGQVRGGAIRRGITGVALPAGTPALVAVGACVLAALAAGAVVGLMPGVAARRGRTHTR